MWQDNNKVKAGIAGGIELTTKMITTHIDDADLCYLGCAGLIEMIEDDKHNLF